MTDEAGPRPLTGTTILEIDNPDAGPHLRLAKALAGKIVADLGATVIKLEAAAGDPVRAMPPFLPAVADTARRSALFQFLNTGKRILKMPAGATARRDALTTLLGASIDGVLWEEGDDDASAIAAATMPRVEIGGWPEGMTKSTPLSEFTVMAVGGLLDIVGDPEREPLRLGGHQASYAAGLAAFTALMAGLAGRRAGLATPPARISLVEVMLWVNWKAAAGAFADGRSPTREGGRSEFQVVACRDGHIALVYGVTQFDAVKALVGDPRLDDPRFATRPQRRSCGEAIYDILRPWFAARTRMEVYELAQGKGIPMGPAFSPFDLLDDPQTLARDFIAAMDDGQGGGLRLPRLPVLWNGRGFAPVAARDVADLAGAFAP